MAVVLLVAVKFKFKEDSRWNSCKYNMQFNNINKTTLWKYYIPPGISAKIFIHVERKSTIVLVT